MIGMHTQPMSGPLGPLSDAVRGGVNELANSGNYYMTPEITRELRHITHGVEHVNLDQDMLASSREWAEHCGPARTRQDLKGAAQALHHTAQTVDNLRIPLGIRHINNQQDNQVRQTHHSAMNRLIESEQCLSPYANQSIDRLKQFCDHVGVTDRYTGYKHSLNRGTRDPVKLGYHWLDEDRKYAGFPQTARGRSTEMGMFDPRKATMSARGVRGEAKTPGFCNIMQKAVKQKPMSIQEQCGINTTFPGKTEYMVRYKRPPLDHKTVPFTINPTPDVTAHGRPQARVVLEPSCTEYQWRYEWPDSAKIEKLPWIKKF